MLAEFDGEVRRANSHEVLPTMICLLENVDRGDALACRVIVSLSLSLSLSLSPLPRSLLSLSLSFNARAVATQSTPSLCFP